MMASGFSILFSILGVVVFSAPEHIIPSEQGTTWQYSMTEEAGPGVRLSDEAENEAGTLRATVLYRIEGTREVDGKKLLEFEMHRSGRITNTDLMTVDEHGLQCWARVDEGGEMTKLDPPQPIVALPVEVGATWDFDGESAGAKVHQHYEIIGQGDVTTLAGPFRAFHIRGEQNAPGRMTIDRWFVPGVGIVKDVTETRSDSGDLLRRISLELTENPKISSRPEVKVKPGGNKLAVSLAQEAVGESRSTFSSVAPKICARWQGRGLRSHAKIRALWIAEQVDGVAPPDYTIDEANATATASDSHGVFTLARPEEGWAAGVYRVEFYVDGALADAVKLKITKSEASRFSPNVEPPPSVQTIVPSPHASP
jgi:hypothetical protein